MDQPIRILEVALTELKDSNQGGVLEHPLDLNRAVSVFRELIQSGVGYSTSDVREVAERVGWSIGYPSKLESIAEIVKMALQGSHPSEGRTSEWSRF